MKKKPKKKAAVKPTGGREAMMLWDLNKKLDAVSRKLDVLTGLVKQVQQTEVYEMASAQDILERVKAQQTVVDSVATLCGQLHDMLQQAKTDPAKLDEAIQLLDSQKDELANAVTANTDAT